MKEERSDGVFIIWVLSAVFFLAVCVVAVIDIPSVEPLLIPNGTETTFSSNTTVAASQASSAIADVDLVNLNSASKEELMTLPGVGEVLAERIIAYREANGRFQTVEELMNVSGIGEKRLEQMRPLVTV